MPRQSQSRFNLFYGLLILLILTATGCAPVFSDARLAGKGRAEITPSLSAAGISADGESRHVVNNFGVHALYGIHDRADLFAGYMRGEIVNDDYGTNTIEFGPKFGLVRDRVAFALPVGFAFGEDLNTSDSWHFYPTGLFTLPLGANLDINPAVRVLIPTCDDCDVLVGLNIGAGIRFDRGRTVLRPEVGVLVSPGEEGFVWHFGFAISVRPGAR